MERPLEASTADTPAPDRSLDPASDAPAADGLPGALLAWGGSETGLDDFRAWHNSEHLPERLAIPGFVRARRFRSLDRSFLFFTLYEMTSIEVLESEPYRALMSDPSPWTKRVLSAPSRGVARLIGRTRFAHERATGGLIAVWRVEALRPPVAAILRCCVELGGDRSAGSALAALRLIESDDKASTVPSAALDGLGAIAVPRLVIIAEGWAGEAEFRCACATLWADTGLDGMPEPEFFMLEVAMMAACRATSTPARPD